MNSRTVHKVFLTMHVPHPLLPLKVHDRWWTWPLYSSPEPAPRWDGCGAGDPTKKYLPGPRRCWQVSVLHLGLTRHRDPSRVAWEMRVWYCERVNGPCFNVLGGLGGLEAVPGLRSWHSRQEVVAQGGSWVLLLVRIVLLTAVIEGVQAREVFVFVLTVATASLLI